VDAFGHSLPHDTRLFFVISEALWSSYYFQLGLVVRVRIRVRTPVFAIALLNMKMCTRHTAVTVSESVQRIARVQSLSNCQHCARPGP